MAGNFQELLVTPTHLPSQTAVNVDQEVRTGSSSNHGPGTTLVFKITVVTVRWVKGKIASGNL